MLEGTINLESGPIRDANPLVPPTPPNSAPLLLRSSASNWFWFLRPPDVFATHQRLYKGASTRVRTWTLK